MPWAVMGSLKYPASPTSAQPGAAGPAQEAGLAGEGQRPGGEAGGGDFRGQAGVHLAQELADQRGAIDPGGAAEPGRRHGDEDRVQAAVGRDRARRCAVAVVPAVAAVLEPGDVGVDRGAGVPAGGRHLRPDRARHPRPPAVGADHQSGADIGGGRSAPHRRAGHPAVGVAQHVVQGGAVADLGARLGGGGGQHRVEQRAPRRIERVDAVLRSDVDHDLLGAVDEPGLPNRRRAGETVEQAPPVEQHHRTAHQRVGRKRVGAGGVALDHQHPRAGPGEQERGGGAGGPGAGDHHVVVRGEGHGRLLQAASRAPRKPAIAGASASASRPTPSMKFESRRRRNRSPRA